MSPINSSPNNQHVAVLAFPFATHAGLLLGLARKLAEAAPGVTFSFFSTTQSNRPLFSVSMPNNIIACDVSDGVPEGYVFSGKPQEDIELFLKVAPENFRRGVEAAEADTGRRISCLLADGFLWFAGEMAEDMGVSWVPLWTSGACSLSVHVYTDLIRQIVGTSDTHVAGRENETLNFIPGFSALRLGDLPSGVLFGNLESQFAIMLHKMGQALPHATAIPLNSFEELDPPLIKDLKSKFPKILNVGPFNLTSPPPRSNKDEHGCLAWLDKQKANSVAYIGFGTVASPSPKEIVALAEALEASATPFLWSLRDSMTSHLPKGILNGELGKVVPWAPQVQVLAHGSIGVFITHCGWNSVLESIAAGVPMIGRPFFGDHQMNTWMVENVWGIGVRVEGGVFTKSGTMRALEVIFSCDEGKKLKEQIARYKELALEAVGPRGSSTENFKTLLEVVTGQNMQG